MRLLDVVGEVLVRGAPGGLRLATSGRALGGGALDAEELCG